MILLLVNGFTPSDLQSSLSLLQSQTKNLGTHKQRQVYWQAYQALQGDLNKYSDMNVDGGKLYGLVKYYQNESHDDDSNNGVAAEGTTEFEPFTKRQKALVQTPRLIMGRHIKLVSDNNQDEAAASGNEFIMPWLGHDEAKAAYDDICNGEACISLDADRGLFISTKLKRKHCANLPTSVTKSLEALMTYIGELQADNPLQSIAWNAHAPPTVTPYNVILTGIWPTSITHHLNQPAAAAHAVIHTPTTSMHEIYDAFLERRNQHYLAQAETLIAKMLTEIAKNGAAENATSVHASSMKDLVTAKRNALLKRVYIDATKHKFIHNAAAEAADGAFEMIVVHARPAAQAGKFEEYGGIVFETFYKLDLSIYG